MLIQPHEFNISEVVIREQAIIKMNHAAEVELELTVIIPTEKHVNPSLPEAEDAMICWIALAEFVEAEMIHMIATAQQDRADMMSESDKPFDGMLDEDRDADGHQPNEDASTGRSEDDDPMPEVWQGGSEYQRIIEPFKNNASLTL